MATLSEVVRFAHFRGYRVVDGRVLSPFGKERKVRTKKRFENSGHYFVFSVSGPDGKITPLPVHKLAAFQKFGESSLEPGVHVRHKDNNSLNNREDNLLLGTMSENMLDRPKEARQAHAAKGAQRLPSETVDAIRRDHATGLSYKDLGARYGLPKSTLSYYLSKTAKRTSYTHRQL